MNRLALIAAVGLAAAPALGQTLPVPRVLPAPPPPAPRLRVMDRPELTAVLADLQKRLDALRADTDSRDAGLAARLDALQKDLDAMKGAEPAVGARIDELAAALDELKDDVARKGDLQKYVRKPNEKEFKTRTAQELELRADWISFRTDEVANLVAGLNAMGADPRLAPAGRALVQAGDAIGGLYAANDGRLRPRLLLRLYWESNRFIDADTFLTVYAQPELQLFVYDGDYDRYVLPRDAAAPDARLGLVIKKAAAALTAGRVTVTAGVLQFTYGAGFFFNPTNPFTPKNPLDPRREVYGVPAAQLDLALVQEEGLTLTLQIAGVAERVRNDLIGQFGGNVGGGGLALLKADTKPVSVTAIAIYQSPNDSGLDSGSFGGIVSTTPFGITASVEALWTEADYGGDYRPDLVASFQGFSAGVGANGMTYVLEYVHKGHGAANAAESAADLARAIERGRGLVVAQLLTQPLARRDYFDLYLEPSLTPKLRINLGGLLGIDDSVGALARFGLDYDFYNFSVHAYGGATFGGDPSEFKHHVIGGFGDLAVLASF
jgi:hypothetical protein